MSSAPAHRPAVGPPRSGRRRATAAHATVYLGALAVLATGADHIEQYYVDQYSAVPTIGTLFLLNFIAAVVVALGLVAPLKRITGRFSDAIRALFAVLGIGLAATSLAALLVSEHSSLFGFMEHGYRTAIVLSIASEVAAVLFLAAFLALGAAKTAWRVRPPAFR